MDAKDLIKLRRQQSEEKVVDHEVKRSEITKKSHTGQPFNYVGRNPSTGQLQVSNGKQRLSVNGVSNSELTANSVVQIFDPGIGSPTANFAPHHPQRQPEPQQSSEEFTGSFAVLLDTIVSGEASPSCRSLQDVWALFAIVKYVKASRVMVLFSFPKDTGSPVPYACPRYRFSSGSWTCDPTVNPESYESYGACAEANPVTCPGGLFPPGLPLGDDGFPNSPGCLSAGSYTTPASTYFEYDLDLLLVHGYEERWYLYDAPATMTSSAHRGLGRYSSLSGYSPDNLLELNPSLVTRWTIKSVYAEFDKIYDKRNCGDKITLTRKYIKYTKASSTTVVSCDESTFTQGGDFSISGEGEESITWTWQQVNAFFKDFAEAMDVQGCGDYTPMPPPPPSIPPYPTPRDPDAPTCKPPEGEPSTYERQFWVGGHQDTPIKLISINAEEEYDYFGSLMTDGYYVTLKWGREIVNGTEQWCKVQTFKTTNLQDWRTTSYHTSKELQPALPGGTAGDVLSTKGDRANITKDGVIEINPTQTVTGAGNIPRTLNAELLTRPQGSLIGSRINATMSYTPNSGLHSTQTTQIYRIVQVIPASLNTGSIGCIQVGNVEVAYSPLFSIPE